MLASRSYDGMTLSLKLWGEEERKGMQVSTDGWDERCVRAVAAVVTHLLGVGNGSHGVIVGVLIFAERVSFNERNE